MTQFGVRRALVATTVLTMWVVPVLAQTRTAGTYPTRESQSLRLGTENPAGTLSEAPSPPPAPEPEPPQVAAAPPPLPQPVPTPSYTPWVASGFVGSSFGTSSDTLQNTLNSDDNVPADLTYGGQVGYLWRGIVGGEFIADFAPNVGFDSILLADQPDVNSYMGNVIGAYPFGDEGRYQPYVSGGFGSIGVRADFFMLADIRGNTFTASANQQRWGSNIGGGIFAYANRFGVRGDVRWYRSSGGNNILNSNTPAENAARTLLSDLHFWRGTLGLAFRW